MSPNNNTFVQNLKKCRTKSTFFGDKPDVKSANIVYAEDIYCWGEIRMNLRELHIDQILAKRQIFFSYDNFG